MSAFPQTRPIIMTTQASNDYERLVRAEEALSVANLELGYLECDAEDLQYLVEIVQIGLRRARMAIKPEGSLVSSPANPAPQ